MPKGTIIFDIETCDKDLIWDLPPEEFVRLIGYKWWDDDEVHLTTDLDEIREALLSAQGIIGHNVHQFDLPAVFGVKSNIPLRLAMKRRVICTMTHAILANPAPAAYTDRHGVLRKVGGPESQLPWFGLDEQAHQLGVKGKTNDIKELAAKWAPEYEVEAANGRIMVKKDISAGFGLIPVDDVEYRDYLVGDVLGSQEVARAMLRKKPMDEYDWRQQEVSSRIFVIRSNGFKVDQDKARARVKELGGKKDELMDTLVREYDFPTEGAKPWDTDPGKRAILALLADADITPKKLGAAWPKTDGWKKKDEHLAKANAKIEALTAKVAEYQVERLDPDTKPRRVATLERWIDRDNNTIRELMEEPIPPYFGLSLSGDTVIDLTKNTGEAETGRLLAELKGQRGLAQSALDCMRSDGFCHADIHPLQKSGRWSTTKPGLTIWDAAGPEKQYWIPDTEDEAIVEFDYAAADARGVAALSGDERFAERFEPGKDSHMINAIIAWGEETVAKDPRGYRQKAKIPGHGWGYRIGAATLSRQTGLSVAEGKTFLEKMNLAFKKVVGWQDRMVRLAIREGYVTNPWGRRMKVDKGREYTQAPALMGQSFTTEVVVDAILSLDIWALRKVKVAVHDALVFSIPRKDSQQWVDYIVSKMEKTFVPKDGVGLVMEMPVKASPLGSNWDEANHK